MLKKGCGWANASGPRRRPGAQEPQTAPSQPAPQKLTSVETALSPTTLIYLRGRNFPARTARIAWLWLLAHREMCMSRRGRDGAGLGALPQSCAQTCWGRPQAKQVFPLLWTMSPKTKAKKKTVLHNCFQSKPVRFERTQQQTEQPAGHPWESPSTQHTHPRGSRSHSPVLQLLDPHYRTYDCPVLLTRTLKYTVPSDPSRKLSTWCPEPAHLPHWVVRPHFPPSWQLGCSWPTPWPTGARALLCVRPTQAALAWLSDAPDLSLTHSLSLRHYVHTTP